MASKLSVQKQWALESLRGLENATLPSYTPDMQRLDERGIRWDVRTAVRHGFTCTMLPLESGLSQDECKQMIDIATDEARGEIGVSMILLRDSFAQNMDLLRYGQARGMSHATIGYPHAFRPRSTDDIYEATRTMCDATDLGIVVYASERFDFGRFHPSSVPFELFDRLVEIPNVMGMKVGFPEPGMVYEVFRRYSDRIQVNIGTAGMVGMFPMLHRHFRVQWGGAGMWEFWQSPERPYMVEYFDLVLRGEYEAAMKVYWAMAPAHLTAMRALGGKHRVGGGDLGFQTNSPAKYAQWSVGGNGGMTRQPDARITPEMRQARRTTLRSIGIEPREPEEEFMVGRVNYETATAA